MSTTVTTPASLPNVPGNDAVYYIAGGDCPSVHGFTGWDYGRTRPPSW